MGETGAHVLPDDQYLHAVAALSAVVVVNGRFIPSVHQRHSTVPYRGCQYRHSRNLYLVRAVATSRLSGFMPIDYRQGACQCGGGQYPARNRRTAVNERTTVRSTRVWCDPARASPPRRIVRIGSMAVHRAATGTIHEDHAPVSPISGYGRATIERERVVLKYVDDDGDAAHRLQEPAFS